MTKRLPAALAPVAFAAVAAFAAGASTASCQSSAPAPIFGCRATDCGAHASCVAGRCQADSLTSENDGGGFHSNAAIDQPGVKRVVVAASELAFVHEGSTSGAVPAVIHLGRRTDGEAFLLAKFPYAYASLGRIVEAYLLLPRPSSATDDAGFFSLHAARIVTPWSARSTSWAARPRLEDVGEPRTRLRTEDAALTRVARLDVKSLVDGFVHAARASAAIDADLGIAVVADDASASGLSLATPLSEDASSLPAGALRCSSFMSPLNRFSKDPSTTHQGSAKPLTSGSCQTFPPSLLYNCHVAHECDALRKVPR